MSNRTFMKKIILVVLPSFFLGVYLFFSGLIIRGFYPIPFLLLDFLTFLDYLFLPIITIFMTVVIKRKFFGRSNKLALYFSLIPGFVLSVDFSYGIFTMGHGYGLTNYLKYLAEDGFWWFIILSLLSSVIGLLVNFTWNKIRK